MRIKLYLGSRMQGSNEPTIILVNIRQVIGLINVGLNYCITQLILLLVDTTCIDPYYLK